MPAEVPTTIEPGVRVGPYEVEAAIGAGGMGAVYRARDTRLQRSVAIKVLRGDVDDLARRRFGREAAAVAALNHPHILTVHETGEVEGHPYLVTEFVDGGTLASWAQAARPSAVQVAELLVGVADGLATAHAAGILHRDVKPQNVLLTRSGYAKLADFGLATVARSAGADVDAATTQDLRTEPGTILGTLAYMSPEQVQGRPLDARSDVFSFGVMLHELVTGHRAFGGATGAALIHAIVYEPPATLPPGVPAPLGAIIGKALEKDPAHRYQSMAEVVVDLRRFLREAAGPADRDTTGRRRRWVPVAAALTLVAVAGAAWALSSRSAPPAAPHIGSLAVLPLKPLVQDTDDGQLGLGLADTIIARIGLVEGLIVRPTSAVRPYGALDTNAMEAATALEVDAVLDGTIQRAGERLRVNLTLVRVGDGATLWSQTFDTAFSDIFTVQDEIAHGVVSQVRPTLDAAMVARASGRPTSNPEAYEAYLRGVASFTSIGAASASVIGDLKAGISQLEHAVALDPGFALAHAQLARAYAHIAVTRDPAYVEQAKAAMARAEALDPDIAELQITRHSLHWSVFGDYQIVPAFQALRMAQRLNANAGHYELGVLYGHLGLIDEAERSLRRALEIDPTNDSARAELVNTYWYSARYEEAIARNASLPTPIAWAHSFYLGAGRVADAGRMMEATVARDPTAVHDASRALLLAWQGRHAEARALWTPAAQQSRMSRTYHHRTYAWACVNGLAGDAAATVRDLEETVRNGMPIYPAFERDRCFDPVRQAPEFVRFMADMKPVWDGYVRAAR
jgi:TolB-like protein/tRNA A-37 threonylcarbamoyl transferase component Bud32/Flp pilus assembly protein TadD